MKILHSNLEKNWYTINNVELTSEQKNVLLTGTDEEKEAVFEYIKQNTNLPAIKKDSDAAIKLYNENKPSGEFVLIHAVINIEDSTGIINYRVDNEHKQLSF